jgi:hypothetical protein
MKKVLLFITICILASCGENDSDLRSLTERENEELFQKNNELIKSIEERNYFLESKIDSLIDQQIKLIEESGMNQEELDKETQESWDKFYGKQ